MRHVQRFGLALLLALSALPPSVLAQGGGAPSAMDPAAAIGMLTDASANESGPAAPFMGLATKIEVDPLFGTATTSIPIELPPGRKLTPDLTLRYSSNAGNGPFGVGWDLPLGCIKRNTARGVPFDYTQSSPVYDDAKGFILVFRGGTILLDQCESGPAGPSCTSWKASSEEAWLDVSFDRGANTWQVTDKSGMVYRYGTGPAPQPRAGLNPSAASGTFVWYLSRIEDANGNSIDASYVLVGSHVYLSQVDYGANSVAGLVHVFHVGLDYEERDDDATTSYRAGFADVVTRRLKSIRVWVDGKTTSAVPTRKYNVGYSEDGDTGFSLLSTVSVTLADSTPPPPPTTFTYQAATHQLAAAADLDFDVLPATDLSILSAGSAGLLAGVVRGFLDVNGDGLPDFLDGFPLSTTDGTLELWLNRGGGHFEQYGTAGTWTDQTWGISGYAFLAHPCFRLIDLDGDGLPDLLKDMSWECTGTSTPPYPYYDFQNVAGTLATSGQPWPGIPTGVGGVAMAYSLLGLQGHPGFVATLTDLNADGLPDLLDCSGLPNPGPFACRFHRNTGNPATGFAAPVTWTVPASNDPGTQHNALTAGLDTSRRNNSWT